MIEYPLVVRHLGCGDGLMMAGAAVELAKEFGGIRYPVWHRHLPTFQEIFRVTPEVELISVSDEHYMFAYQRAVILTGIYKKAPGYWEGDRQAIERAWRDAERIDQRVYREMGIPLDKKWESFPWKYDFGNNPIRYGKPYIFVHDDSSRGFTMDLDRIGRHWTQADMVCPDRDFTHPMTWYAPLMIGAAEVHCINSCFIWFRDLLPEIPGQKLFYHRYARSWNLCDMPTFRLNWEILD